MKRPDQFVASDMGSVPIGYTTAVTPMQMLNVFTTIANGGVTLPPRLVSATIDENGERHNRPAKRGRRIVSEQTAAEVNEMLRGVVREGGTGELANIDGYTVAGKTGTSRKPPYETERYMASFAGFAPAEDPRLALIVVIDQPGTDNNSYYGGKVAAPLFKSIMTYALHLENVPPSGMLSSEAASPGPAVAIGHTTAPASPPTPTPPTPPTPTVAVPPPAAPAALSPAGIVTTPVP